MEMESENFLDTLKQRVLDTGLGNSKLSEVPEVPENKDIICRLGMYKSGNEAVELIFSGPISKNISKALKESFFSYDYTDQIWRSKRQDTQVRIAKKLANKDLIGSWLPEELNTYKKPVPKVNVTRSGDGTLKEYRAALQELAECWNCDSTTAMIKAVIDTAKNL